MLSIRRLSLRRLIAWPDSRRLLYIDGGQTPMVAPSGLANKPILHKPILQSRFKSSIAIDGSPFEQVRFKCRAAGLGVSDSSDIER